MIDATDKPLALTVDWESDCLEAIEYGEVVDGKAEEEYFGISEQFAYVARRPDCPELIGFVIQDLPRFKAAELEEIWSEPWFDVPVLGLSEASAGMIVTTALAAFEETSTVNAYLFQRAVTSQGAESSELDWRSVLSAGDMRGHFGLGYTLWERGRFEGAHRHLLIYTELAPFNSWAWVWLGRACASLGQLDEARRAFEKAIELEEAGGFKTDAFEYLSALASA